MHLVSLGDDVLLEDDPSGALLVVSNWGEQRFDRPSPVVRESLRRMSLGPVSVANLAPPERADDGADLHALLTDLSGCVVRSIGVRDQRGLLLSVLPCVPEAEFRPAPLDVEVAVRLSRFSTLRWSAGELLLESPDASFRVVLHQVAAARIATQLGTSFTVSAAATAASVSVPVARHVVGYLLAAGIAVSTASGQFAEDEPPRGLWPQHALTFHQRSRSRRRDTPGDGPSPGEVQAAPATRPPPDGPRIALFRPDLTAHTGPSLSALLEVDHTCPDFSPLPLTGEQVGELLFRAVRVRGPGPPHLPHGMVYPTTQRPYLSIACLYELELYLSVDRCTGIPRGSYHLDPAAHSLTLVNDDPASLDGLLDIAKVAAGCVRRPSAMLSITARMARTSPLGGAAYATTLMHVGALHQTLTLVARSMGLAAHPVPVDANGATQRALKLPWPGEVGVGECVLDRPT